MRLYVVPAERLSEEDLQNFSNNALAMAMAANNAVPLSRPEEVPVGVQDYYVFAFFLDRLPRDSEVDLLISESPFGIEDHTLAPLEIDYAGWRVLVLPGQFALDGEKELFFKAVYKPGVDAQNRVQQPVLAGVFSTQAKAPR